MGATGRRGLRALTIDPVAARAQGSKPVLYRRWKTREDLLLTHAITTRNPMTALISGMLGSYFSQSGPTRVSYAPRSSVSAAPSSNRS